MKEKELLKMLNYIEYNDNELSDLEKKSIDSRNKYAENLYMIKNEGVLRKIAFVKLKKIVECKIGKDEEIKCQGIFFNSLLREKVHRYPLSPGLIAPIYFGVFATDKRIFFYKLSVKYEIINDTEYINDIENIDYIKNSIEFSDTFEIAFKDERKMQLRSFNKENKNLLISLISYLDKEKKVLIYDEKVDPYHERFSTKPMLIKYWIVTLVLLLIFLYNFLTK